MHFYAGMPLPSLFLHCYILLHEKELLLDEAPGVLHTNKPLARWINELNVWLFEPWCYNNFLRRNKPKCISHCRQDISRKIMISRFCCVFAYEAMVTKGVTWVATENTLLVRKQTRVKSQTAVCILAGFDKNPEKICS